MKPISEAMRERARRTQVVFDGPGQACRPLVRRVGERFFPLGSCVLLQSGASLFLCTASHVVKDVTDVHIGGVSKTVSIGGQAYGSFAPGDDQTDFTIVALNDECQSGLSETPRLSAHQVDMNHDAGRDAKQEYVLGGFPATRFEELSHTDLSFEPFLLNTTAVPRSTYDRLGRFDPVHLVLGFDEKAIRKKFGVTPPKLDGVSGGGVWAVGGDGSAKLVALAIERKRAHQAIVAVRIGVLIELVRYHAPSSVADFPVATRFELGPTQRAEGKPRA